MENNENPYIMVRKSLEDIEKSKGKLTVEDAMDVMYNTIDFVIGQLTNGIRCQAAIAAMQGMVSNPALVDDSNIYTITIEKDAVAFADSLIKELKKKK